MKSNDSLQRPSIKLTAVLRGAPAAVVLLTRIPVPRYRAQPEDWCMAPAWFPVAGAALGTLLGGIWLVADALGSLTAAVLVVTSSVVLTGALHEDGLADSLDALGGSTSRDRLFEILKDSRNGTYGTLALVASVLLRVALLTALDRAAGAALVLSHTLARTSPVWLVAELRYVTPTHSARNVAVANTGRREAMLATGAALLISGILVAGRTTSFAPTAIAWSAVVVAAVACARIFRRRAGGITGDFLGMNEQISECLVLMVLAIAR